MAFISKKTNGVAINVQVYYQPKNSSPINNNYLYAYRITIINQNPHTIQLLSRHWHIRDSTGTNKEVQGDGVVGVQPIIEPNESYQYVSACNLSSDIGKMYGTYTMLNLLTNTNFEVIIPAFVLIYPYKLN